MTLSQRWDVVTIFPDYLGPLRLSLLGKAIERGDVALTVHDLRHFTDDVHRSVDDTPYGGGPGMVMLPEPWGRALDAIAPPELRTYNGGLTLATRQRLAGAAFARTSAYDRAVSAYFAGQAGGELLPSRLDLSFERRALLRYGENPHQPAAFYVESPTPSGCVAGATVLHGKELSYNNLLDLDSALNLVREFADPAAAVIKHNNPCGCAVAGHAGGGVSPGLRGRPAQRLRRRDRLQPRSRRGDGDADDGAEPLRRVRHRPGLHEGGVRDPDDAAELEEERAPAANGAAGAAGRRALDFRRVDGGLLVQARDVEGRRFQRREGGDQAAADRSGMGRPAIRLAGVQARQEQRHRAGKGRHGASASARDR